MLTGVILIGLGIWLITSGSIPRLITLSFNGTNSNLFRDSSILLIFMGVIVIIVSVVGFVGAILENTIILGVYMGLLALVFFGEVIGAILAIVFKDQIVYNLTTDLANELSGQLNQSSSSHYYNVSPNSSSCYTSDQGYEWDFVQITFKCCGIQNGNSGYESLQSGSYNFQSMCPGLKSKYVPFSCCPFINASTTFGDFHTNPDNEYNAQNLVDCTQPYTQGCSNSLALWVNKYAPVLIGIGIGFGMLEMFGIIFALCLCQNVGEDY